MILASSEPPWRALWPIGAVLGRSWGLLEHLGSHLEASWAILSHLGGHIGLSEALLEPSWAILDALTAREPPRPGPGEGVGGGGRGRGQASQLERVKHGMPIPTRPPTT